MSLEYGEIVDALVDIVVVLREIRDKDLLLCAGCEYTYSVHAFKASAPKCWKCDVALTPVALPPKRPGDPGFVAEQREAFAAYTSSS